MIAGCCGSWLGLGEMDPSIKVDDSCEGGGSVGFSWKWVLVIEPPASTPLLPPVAITAHATKQPHSRQHSNCSKLKENE